MATQSKTHRPNTSQILWLGFGLLTAVLAVAILAIVLRLRAVEGRVSEMADGRARASAARSFEIAALDFALDVRRYLDTGDGQIRRMAADETAAVEQYIRDYQALAGTTRQREIAARFTALWRQFNGLGQALMDAENRQPRQRDLTAFSELGIQLERFLEDEAQREGDTEYHAQREAAVEEVRNVEGFALRTLLLGVLIAAIASGAVWRGVVRAERAVRESREQLRVTLASIGDGVITTDMEGRVTSLNPVAEALTGWKNDEASGVSLTTVFRIVNENSGRSVENPAIMALREGVIIGLANHSVLIAKDGTERPIDDSAAPIRDGAGNVIGCVLIFRDVSDRRKTERAVRESEARKAAILETALDCVITIDHHGKILDFNPAAERTFGYSRTNVLGKEMAELLIPPSLRKKHYEGFSRYFATGEGPVLGKRLEMTALRADGAEFPIELAITRISGEGPAIFTGYVRDITERKELENRLRQVVDQLSEADRRKNEFLAMLAHELRNPLAPISNALEILRLSDGTQTSVAPATEVMHRQLGQMVHLIDDLLDVSRISQGKIELRREPIELASVVNHAVEASRSRFEESGVTLTITVASKPIYLDADPTRLSQVIGNLLNNAAKFTPRGGQVWLIAERDRGQAVIRVRDTGIGIAPNQLQRVFDLFMQGDTTLERKQSGLGIGLALARSLVEHHGGTIDVHSPGLGQGTEFVVCLPVLLELPKSLPSEPAHDTKAVRHKVLVVDDNHDSAESLAMLLEMRGHEVRMAHDGIEAVEVAAKFEPDVVLLDIGLPKLNGYEAGRRIRELPKGKEILLVALTGFGQEEDRNRSAESGFDAHFVKPVDHDALSRLMADSGA